MKLKRLLRFFSLFWIFFAPLCAVACGFSVNQGKGDTDQDTDTPDGGVDTEEEIDPDKAISFRKNLVEFNNYLNSFNKGANYKLYEDYMSKTYVGLGTKDSRYVPSKVFVHKDDEIKVYLDKTKTTLSDISFIKSNPGVFAIGLDGHWGSTIEPFLNPDYKVPTESYYSSTQKKAVTKYESVVTENEDYVITIKATTFGILYTHIASELFISKILVNNIENDISRTNFTYSETENDNEYPEFWNKVYQAYDEFIQEGASVEKQITTKTPMIIFYGERFNFIIDSIKMFAIINTATKAGVNYKDSNLNNFLKSLDFIGNNVLEYQGISTQGAGVFNKLFPFQKQNVVLSDGGAGLFYNTNQYFAMHSRLTGGAINFTSFVADKSTFYKTQQFTSTLTGKNGQGYLYSTSDYKKDIYNFLRQSNWGFIHELGHNYQMYNYKLSTWGEVTVNISVIGTNIQAWRNGYFGSGNDFYDYFFNRSSFLNISSTYKNNPVRTNALYEKFVSNRKNYDPTNSSKTQLANDMELIFWVQLCLGLGDSFIAELNNYYRANSSAIWQKITQLKDYYTSISSQYNSNFIPDNHARLDVLIDSITKITKTNLKSFFTKWGLEIPESTQKLMDSYGTDYGNNLFKIIFDNEYTGMTNEEVWTSNMNGGFLVPGISEKMKSFYSWGVIGENEFLAIPTSISQPNILAENTDITFDEKLVAADKYTIYYQIQNSFSTNPEALGYIKNYWKIRGDNGDSGLVNDNYYHIYQNSEDKTINFVKNSNKVIDQNADGDVYFAYVVLLNANGSLVRSAELKNNGSIAPNNFNWNYLDGYQLKISFLNENFILQDPKLGSQIWNKTTNEYSNFSGLVNEKNEYIITL